MRSAFVVLAAMFAVALLLPMSQTKSVPLSGIRLVGEQHPETPDLIAAGKNGNTGKSGKTGKNGKNSDGPSTAAGAGGFFFGAERLGVSVGPDLVPVALR